MSVSRSAARSPYNGQLPRVPDIARKRVSRRPPLTVSRTDRAADIRQTTAATIMGLTSTSTSHEIVAMVRTDTPSCGLVRFSAPRDDLGVLPIGTAHCQARTAFRARSGICRLGFLGTRKRSSCPVSYTSMREARLRGVRRLDQHRQMAAGPRSAFTVGWSERPLRANASAPFAREFPDRRSQAC